MDRKRGKQKAKTLQSVSGRRPTLALWDDSTIDHEKWTLNNAFEDDNTFLEGTTWLRPSEYLLANSSSSNEISSEEIHKRYQVLSSNSDVRSLYKSKRLLNKETETTEAPNAVYFRKDFVYSPKKLVTTNFVSSESLGSIPLPPIQTVTKELKVIIPQSDTDSQFRDIAAAISAVFEAFVEIPSNCFLWELIYPHDQQTGFPIVNPSGKYAVKLFYQDSWRKIFIDDRMPFDDKGNCLIIQSENPNEIWVSLLAKAIVKLSKQLPTFPSIIYLLTGLTCETNNVSKILSLTEFDETSKFATKTTQQRRLTASMRVTDSTMSIIPHIDEQSQPLSTQLLLLSTFPNTNKRLMNVRAKLQPTSDENTTMERYSIIPGCLYSVVAVKDLRQYQLRVIQLKGVFDSHINNEDRKPRVFCSKSFWIPENDFMTIFEVMGVYFDISKQFASKTVDFDGKVQSSQYLLGIKNETEQRLDVCVSVLVFSVPQNSLEETWILSPFSLDKIDTEDNDFRFIVNSVGSIVISLPTGVHYFTLHPPIGVVATVNVSVHPPESVVAGLTRDGKTLNQQSQLRRPSLRISSSRSNNERQILPFTLSFDEIPKVLSELSDITVHTFEGQPKPQECFQWSVLGVYSLKFDSPFALGARLFLSDECERTECNMRLVLYDKDNFSTKIDNKRTQEKKERPKSGRREKLRLEEKECPSSKEELITERAENDKPLNDKEKIDRAGTLRQLSMTMLQPNTHGYAVVADCLGRMNSTSCKYTLRLFVTNAKVAIEPEIVRSYHDIEDTYSQNIHQILFKYHLRVSSVPSLASIHISLFSPFLGLHPNEILHKLLPDECESFDHALLNKHNHLLHSKAHFQPIRFLVQVLDRGKVIYSVECRNSVTLPPLKIVPSSSLSDPSHRFVVRAIILDEWPQIPTEEITSVRAVVEKVSKEFRQPSTPNVTTKELAKKTKDSDNGSQKTKPKVKMANAGKRIQVDGDLHWRLQIGYSSPLEVKVDTEREDLLAQTKASWESANAGRAHRAESLRESWRGRVNNHENFDDTKGKGEKVVQEGEEKKTNEHVKNEKPKQKVTQKESGNDNQYESENSEPEKHPEENSKLHSSTSRTSIEGAKKGSLYSLNKEIEVNDPANILKKERKTLAFQFANKHSFPRKVYNNWHVGDQSTVIVEPPKYDMLKQEDLKKLAELLEKEEREYQTTWKQFQITREEDKKLIDNARLDLDVAFDKEAENYYALFDKFVQQREKYNSAVREKEEKEKTAIRQQTVKQQTVIEETPLQDIPLASITPRTTSSRKHTKDDKPQSKGARNLK